MLNDISFDNSCVNVADTMPSDENDGEGGIDMVVRKLDTVFASAETVSDAMTTSNSFRVFLRIRPNSEASEEENSIRVLNNATILTTPPEMSQVSRIQKSGPKEFVFSRVFDGTATQDDIFDDTILGMVDGAVGGSNGLAFTYGMTNSGKTYTVLGTRTDPGILPKSLKRILSSPKLATGKITVSISVFEIYNERIYDLLGTNKRRVALQLQDRMGKVKVKGISRHFIPTMDTAMNLLDRAQSNRRAAATALNQDSSRSHGIFSIEIRHKKDDKLAKLSEKDCDDDIYDDEQDDDVDDDVSQEEDDENTSVLWIVDLAGSERAIRTGAGGTGIRQQEANTINKSLMNLFRCLDSLRKRQDNIAHTDDQAASNADGKLPRPSTICVPFRESKLTHLFMNHLTGSQTNSTQLIVAVNPNPLDYDETQHVLSNSAIATKVRLQTDLSRENRANYLINSSVYDFNGRRIDGKEEKKSEVGGQTVNGGFLVPALPDAVVQTNSASSSLTVVNASASSAMNVVGQETRGFSRDFSVRLSQTGARIGKLGVKQDSLVPATGTTATQQASSSRITLQPPARGPLQKATSVNSILSSITLNQDQQAVVTNILNQNEELKKNVAELTEQMMMIEEKTRMEVLKQVSIQEMQHASSGSLIGSKKMELISANDDTISVPVQDESQLTSTKKLKVNRLMALVDEMQDRLEECEEEMNRMKQDNYREANQLRGVLRQACLLLQGCGVKVEDDWWKFSEVNIRKSNEFKRKRSDADEEDEDDNDDDCVPSNSSRQLNHQLNKNAPLIVIQEDEDEEDQAKKRARSEEDEEFELRRKRDVRLQNQGPALLQFVPLKRISDVHQLPQSNSGTKKQPLASVENIINHDPVIVQGKAAKVMEQPATTSSTSSSNEKPAAKVVVSKKNLVKSFFGIGTPISKRLRSTSKPINE